MLTPVCLTLLGALLALRLVGRLRRLHQARASAMATRLGARLPATWRPPAVPAAMPLAPSARIPRDDWSRYERPAYQRRAQPLSTPAPGASAVCERGELPC
jgi:hypothetical protein